MLWSAGSDEMPNLICKHRLNEHWIIEMSAGLRARAECRRLVNALAALLVWDGYSLGDATGRQSKSVGGEKRQRIVHG